MEKRVLQSIAILMMAFGVIIVFSSPGITGFAVAENTGKPDFRFIGIAFIVLGGVILMAREESGELEKRIHGAINSKKPTTERGRLGVNRKESIVFVDTNYLIDSIKDADSYHLLMEDIEDQAENKNPLIVSKRVIQEFKKFYGENKYHMSDREAIEKAQLMERKKNVLNMIDGAERKTRSFEKVVPGWTGEKRREYTREAIKIMKETKKALTYEYAKHKYYKNRRFEVLEPNLTPKQYFGDPRDEKDKDEREDREALLESCYKFEDQLTDCKGDKKKIARLFRRYEPTLTDTEILAQAMYVADLRTPARNEVKSTFILTKDEHLHQAEYSDEIWRGYRERNRGIYAIERMEDLPRTLVYYETA